MVVLASGCATSERKYPIPREILPDVLVAVYVSEAEASVNGASMTDARVEALRAFGYDTTDFNETIRMLAEDPETGKEAYQAVLDSVIFEQREIRSKLMADSVHHREADSTARSGNGRPAAPPDDRTPIADHQ